MRQRVQWHLRRQRKAWLMDRSFDCYLLLLALCFGIAGLLLFANGGMTAKFFLVQHAGLQLLPPQAWENITFFGDTLIALTIVLIFCHRYPHLVIAVLIAALIATLLIHGIKNLLNTPRPPGLLASDVLTVIGPVYKQGSMPSGHSATAFILAGFLSRCTSSLHTKILMLLAAALVAWSRVVCGVHWPVDGFAGAAIGLLSVWCALKMTDRLVLRLKLYVSVCGILLACAVYLPIYNAGFHSTSVTAQVLSFGALFYWSLSWYVTAWWSGAEAVPGYVAPSRKLPPVDQHYY